MDLHDSSSSASEKQDSRLRLSRTRRALGRLVNSPEDLHSVPAFAVALLVQGRSWMRSWRAPLPALLLEQVAVTRCLGFPRVGSEDRIRIILDRLVSRVNNRLGRIYA